MDTYLANLMGVRSPSQKIIEEEAARLGLLRGNSAPPNVPVSPDSANVVPTRTPGGAASPSFGSYLAQMALDGGGAVASPSLAGDSAPAPPSPALPSAQPVGGVSLVAPPANGASFTDRYLDSLLADRAALASVRPSPPVAPPRSFTPPPDVPEPRYADFEAFLENSDRQRKRAGETAGWGGALLGLAGLIGGNATAGLNAQAGFTRGVIGRSDEEQAQGFENFGQIRKNTTDTYNAAVSARDRSIRETLEQLGIERQDFADKQAVYGKENDAWKDKDTALNSRIGETRKGIVARDPTNPDSPLFRTPAEQNKERLDVLGYLDDLDADSQQEALGLLEESGDLARLGIPATKDAQGRYAFSLRRAAPPKAIVDTKAVAQKERADRLKAEQTRLMGLFTNPRTTPDERTRIERRLKQIATLVPEVGMGMIPSAKGFTELTPGEKRAEKNAAFSRGMAVKRLDLDRAKFAAQQERERQKSAGGAAPLRAETVTGALGEEIVKGAKGVDFTGMPLEVLRAMEQTPSLVSGTDGEQLKGVKISATGKDAKGYYVDFVLPPGNGREGYRTLTRRLQNMNGIADNEQANAFFVDGKPQAGGRYKSGRSVRVVFGKPKVAPVFSPPSVPTVTFPASGVHHSRAQPRNGGGLFVPRKAPFDGGIRKGKPSALATPRPVASPVIVNIEEMK